MSQKRIKRRRHFRRTPVCQCSDPNCQTHEIDNLMERLHAPCLHAEELMEFFDFPSKEAALCFVFHRCKRHNIDAVCAGREAVGTHPFLFAADQPDGSAFVSLHSLPEALAGPRMSVN
jgi:hypothetical protein